MRATRFEHGAENVKRMEKVHEDGLARLFTATAFDTERGCGRAQIFGEGGLVHVDADAGDDASID